MTLGGHPAASEAAHLETAADALPAPAWYALRTRSRHEKVVRDELLARGVEPFLPLWNRWSRWKDRHVRIATPLFSGYCFARFGPADRLRVMTVRGVVALVGGKSGPEPVTPRELEAVRALVDGPLRFDPCPLIEVGMEVEVIRGPLVGVRGRLLRKGRTSRLLVGVNLIRQGVSLDIDAADVRSV